MPENVSEFNNDAGYITNADLPTVPENVSEFNNDAGYITNADLPEIPEQVQADWNETDENAASFIQNKPTIPTVPENVSEFNNDAGYITSADLPTVPENVSEFNNDAGYITNADLPEIPEQVQADWNETDENAPSFIQNKPTIPTVPENVSEFNNDAGYITNDDLPEIPEQVNADWEATSGAAKILNKPDISELQIQSISHDTLYFTNGTYAVMGANWNNVTNKPAFAPVAFSNDYNDLSNTPENLSDFNNDAGYITNGDIPAQQQANWNETDATKASYIQNKPNMDDYLTDADLSNYVTKTEDESIGGEKTFTDYTTFEDEATFNDDVYFNDYTYFYNVANFYEDAYFEDWVGFYNDIYVSNYTGRLRVPSVLESIESDGSFNISDKLGGNTCNNAVNFCDLQTVYDDLAAKMQNKLNELSDAFDDQVQDLLDSIAKLNKQLNTPKDGEACPNTPTVTDVDGNTYSTVRIGNQCWMRENLRVEHWPNGTTAVTSPSTPSLGKTVAGLRYSFNDVMASTSASTTSAATQGICPAGWRVPSNADFEQLVSYAQTKANASKALMAPYGWTTTVVEGQNALGMSFLPNNGTNYCELFTTNGSEWDKGEYTSNDDFYMYESSASTYHLGVRCIRANSNGEANTIPSPTVETYAPAQALLDISTTSVTLRAGRIVTDGDMAPLTNIVKAGYVRSSAPGTFTDATLRLGKTNTTTGASVTSISSFPYELTSINISGLISNTRYYYRVYAINAQHDTVYGAVNYFTTESNEKACPGMENVTYLGKTYPTVKIGSQCWLARNLRNTTYSDGSTSISGYTTPAGGLSDNNGYLYSSSAVMRGTVSSTAGIQGICPSGWHVPTATEFETMKSTLQADANMTCNSTAANIAKALASTNGWTSNSNTCAAGNNQSGNNASGFNAYPAGFNNSSGSIDNGTRAAFRTTSDTIYYFYNTDATLKRAFASNTNKYSVRCIQGNGAPNVITSTTSPTVSVNIASSVSGQVLTTGGSTTNFVRGIVYSSSNNNPTVGGTGCNTKTSSGTTGTFSVDLTGLTQGITYYYRAYATNDKGTSYGEVKSFTTKSLAVVTTSGYQPAQTATLFGKITSASSGTITTWGFDLQQSTDEGATYSHVTYVSTTNGSQTGEYSVTTPTLVSNGYYRFKAYVIQTIDGTSYTSWASNWMEMRIPGTPSVTTVSAVYAGNNGTTWTYTGNVTNAGWPIYTEKGFVVGNSSNSTPTLENCWYHRTVSGTSTGTFTYSDGWGSSYAGNTYYIRAYVKNSFGTTYGSTITITIPSAPTIGFANNYESPYYYSTNITKNSIKLMTDITNYGASNLNYSNVNERGLLYTTSSSVSSSTPTSSNISTSASDAGSKWVKVSNGSPAGSVATISGLSPNTIYYIKSYATTNWGTGYSSVTKTVKTPLNCGQTLTDQNGNTYATTKIGSQCWMKSNLKATRYDNTASYGGSGTAITLRAAGSASSTSTPYYYYPNGSSSNTSSYGNLYNWPGATGYGVSLTSGGSNMTTSQGKVQGACPRGWHIPTRNEWQTLDGNIDSYFSSFSPQWAGYIDASGTQHSWNSNYTECWSTTQYTGTTNYYYWYYNNDSHDHNYDVREGGAVAKSVRCVQDISY